MTPIALPRLRRPPWKTILLSLGLLILLPLLLWALACLAVWLGQERLLFKPAVTPPSTPLSTAPDVFERVVEVPGARLSVLELRRPDPVGVVFFLHGNRDFLFGPAAARAAHLSLLDDPAVLTFGGRRWLLSHGDALCLDDADYLRFRAQVRTPEWQTSFLAQALDQRRAVARSLRQQSEHRKQSGVPYADVDAALAHAWLQAANAHTLIHGHTHKPADHAMGDSRHRHVLSDWHLDAHTSRAGVLRVQLGADGVTEVRRLGLDQVA